MANPAVRVGSAGQALTRSRDPDAQSVDIEVWDYKAAKSFRGEAQINLKDILDRGRMRETCRWGRGADGGCTRRQLRRTTVSRECLGVMPSEVCTM